MEDKVKITNRVSVYQLSCEKCKWEDVVTTPFPESKWNILFTVSNIPKKCPECGGKIKAHKLRS